MLSRVPFLFAGTKPKNQTITIARQRGWDGISSVASPSLVYGHALGTGPLLGQAHSWDMPLGRAHSRDRPTFGTGPFLGQTHSWDRPTLGTGPFLGQAYSWDRPTRLKNNPANPNKRFACVIVAYDFPERDRRVVAGRRERSSRWRWHCPHRNLHLCHCRMQSTEMADKGLLSTILGMPRSTCAAAQIIPRGVKTIAKYARLSSSFTSSSTPSAHVTLGWALRSSPIKWCGGVAC